MLRCWTIQHLLRLPLLKQVLAGLDTRYSWNDVDRAWSGPTADEGGSEFVLGFQIVPSRVLVRKPMD